MSGVFKIVKIDGKGLGFIATTDMKKGAMILEEKGQICANNEKEVRSSEWIKSVMISFHQMNANDQSDFLDLHNKFADFPGFPNLPDILELTMEVRKNVDPRLFFFEKFSIIHVYSSLHILSMNLHILLSSTTQLSKCLSLISRLHSLDELKVSLLAVITIKQMLCLSSLQMLPSTNFNYTVSHNEMCEKELPLNLEETY